MEESPADDAVATIPLTDYLAGFTVLTEYEAGYAAAAIDWVARGGKPVVELGIRQLTAEDILPLAADLNRCLDFGGVDQARGFIMQDRSEMWGYGFYQYPWVLAALRLLREEAPRIEGPHLHWVQGLLFGYDSAAIQRFLTAHAHRPEIPNLDGSWQTLGKVEIVGSPASWHPLRDAA